MDSTLTLLWQSDEAISQNYSIFVHVLDQQGNLISQADGVPYDGLYPLTHWLPNSLIKDVRQLDLNSQAHTLALGIYDPAADRRLPATDVQDNPLPNNSFLIPVKP